MASPLQSTEELLERADRAVAQARALSAERRTLYQAWWGRRERALWDLAVRTRP